MTRLDDRLHRTADDLQRAAATIPARPVAVSHQFRRVIGWGAAAIAIAVLVALPIWLGGLGDAPESPPVGGSGSGDTTVVSPTTTALPTTDIQPRDTTIVSIDPTPGPISDDEFAGAAGPAWDFFRPGSAVLVAQREDERYGHLSLFFFMSDADEWSSDASEWLCVTATGPILADPDPNGKTLRLGAGATCGSSDSTIHERGLVAGGTCLPGYEHFMLAVYGIDPAARSATVALTDGRTIGVEIVEGAILAAWEGVAGVDGITLDGAPSETTQWLDDILTEYATVGEPQCVN